ncbi:resistance protein, partial [Trifolium medium]|nr:resistance protein [Trifolium medium]
ILMAIRSPSSSFSYRFTYQVFLSFRGTDTRYGFTGNLYKALIDKGIHTFIDDSDLQRGDEITPSLIKAIEESRIFVPVFSINYASSSYCLDELVHIIHYNRTMGRLVLPVFYGVDPTHVRHQNGSYGEDITKHEERYEYQFIGEIVNCISNKINRVSLHVAEYPVGLESRVQKVKLLLDKGSNDEVHMVGLY